MSTQKTDNVRAGVIAIVIPAILLGGVFAYTEILPGWAAQRAEKVAKAARDAEVRAMAAEAVRAVEARKTGTAYLARCSVCKKDVSSQASSCPHCGHPR